MARHWSVFVSGGLTEKQAWAIDKMAEDAGMGEGINLLMDVSGCSRSKVQKMDRLTLRKFVDAVFKKYGKK
jgi:hypothetical protein